jgi:hypothetical protein
LSHASHLQRNPQRSNTRRAAECLQRAFMLGARRDVGGMTGFSILNGIHTQRNVSTEYVGCPARNRMFGAILDAPCSTGYFDRIIAARLRLFS